MARKPSAKERPPLLSELTDIELQKALKAKMPDVHPLDALSALVARSAPRLPGLLRDRLEKAGDAEVRASSAAALGTHSHLANRKALTAALEDEEPEVVRRAALSLGRIGQAAELEALRKFRPRHPLARLAVKTAKTLLTYRLGEKRGLLKAPPQSTLLELGKQKSQRIGVTAVSLTDQGLWPRLASEAVELSLTDRALGIDCGRWRYQVIFDQRTFAKDAEALFTKSGVMGILLRSERIDNKFYRYAYLLTQPGVGNNAHLFVMRLSGEVAYYGHVTRQDSGLVFDLQALSTRHTRPIRFSGTIDPSDLGFSDIQARLAVDKDPAQPTQVQPRKISPL